MNPKRLISILDRNKYDLLDYYHDTNITVELYKNFESDRIGSIISKHSKQDGGPIDEVIDRIEKIRNVNKTPPEETIAERVKLR